MKIKRGKHYCSILQYSESAENSRKQEIIHEKIKLSLAQEYVRVYKNRRMTLLNTREVAEQLGVSVVRVRQMIREGKIEAHNLGRDYAISKDALANVVVYRKPGRPPLTDEERAARAERRTAEKGVQALQFEPPATRAKPARKARAKKAGVKKAAKKTGGAAK